MAGEKERPQPRADAVGGHDQVGVQRAGAGDHSGPALRVARIHAGHGHAETQRAVWAAGREAGRQQVHEVRAQCHQLRIAETRRDRAQVGADQPVSVRTAQAAPSLDRGETTHRIAEAYRVEGVQSVRAQAQAGTHRLEHRSALENGHVPALPGQRHPGRQPADTCPGYYRTPPRHDRLPFCHYRCSNLFVDTTSVVRWLYSPG
jgi:hypothetical protein